MENLLKIYKLSYDVNDYLNYSDLIIELYTNNPETFLKFNLKDDTVVLLIGIYFYDLENLLEAEKWLLASYSMRNKKASFYLGLLYTNLNNSKLLVYYFIDSIENNNTQAIINLGEHYYLSCNFEKMFKYYDMAIKEKNYNAYLYYLYYAIDENNEEQIEKYCKLCIDNKNFDFIFPIFEYYKKCQKYERIKYYAEFGTLYNNVFSLFILGKYYIDYENNEELMLKYWILSIENEGINALYAILGYFKDDLKKFNILFNIKKKYPELTKVMNNLLTNPIVQNYNNKLKLFTKLNFIEECIVCYTTKLNICFDCGHTVCHDCYIKMDKCHFKCNKIKNVNM